MKPFLKVLNLFLIISLIIVGPISQVSAQTNTKSNDVKVENYKVTTMMMALKRLKHQY